MLGVQTSFKICFYPAKVSVETGKGTAPGASSLAIDRNSGSIKIEQSGASTAFAAAPQRIINAHGILGIINLLKGPYLVAVTGRESAGTIGNSAIYKVTETKVIRLGPDNRTLAGIDAFDESRYLALLDSALSAKSFYFSYDYDLTSSLQRQSQDTRASASRSLWECANDEFFFNKYLSQPLIDAIGSDPASAQFILPVIHGFFACNRVVINGSAFNYVLVTRRGRKRQGTRYFSRGADSDGNVSNFAETEQILDLPVSSPNLGTDGAGTQLSYVQIRGSIPVIWAQVINMKYVPLLKIDVGESKERFDRHINRLINDYESVVAVNLVNKKKYEKPMGDAFKELSAGFGNPERYHYTHFDFHKECSKMRWDRISLLIDELSEYLTKFGYFGKDQQQHGVVRTNCMDCLDRTNVVQAEIARTILTKQLRDKGMFTDTDAIANFPELQNMLRNVWADNADAVSCAYSGTGALKTDFTRTGKRTKGGALQDGRNSVERYVRGNFLDGERQDGIDLLLGRYEVKMGTHPFTNELTLESKTLVGAVYVCVAMLVFAFFAPRGNHWFSWSNIVFTNSWLVVFGLVVRSIMQSHTAELLNWPKLSEYPYRPSVMHANATKNLPLLDRILSSSDTKASLRSDDIKKAWPTDKKLA